MDQEIQKAKLLIEEQNYIEARKILQPLAMESEEARNLLVLLNTQVPSPISRSSSWGCLKNVSGCFIGGCSILLFCLVIACGSTYWYSTLHNRLEKYSIEENHGRGSKENPILFGDTIKFPNYELVILELADTATTSIPSLSSNSTPLKVDTKFVGVKMRMRCPDLTVTDNICNGRLLTITAIDTTNTEWTQSYALDLNGESFNWQNGDMVEGWIIFEIPQSSSIQFIRLRGGSDINLYAFAD